MTWNSSSTSGLVAVKPPHNLLGYLYVWVADQIAAQIASGQLPPHTALPSERELAGAFGVSLGTARHATRLLQRRGLVITLRSKGTYVAPKRSQCE